MPAFMEGGFSLANRQSIWFKREPSLDKIRVYHRKGKLLTVRPVRVNFSAVLDPVNNGD